uniref:Uncharacterized protein n=1 Tax=Brassica oleracea var. oleracea TaxID=109376 RepID=A0A0D3AIG1_BRAOL
MWVGPMIAHSPPLSLYNHTPPTLRGCHKRILIWMPLKFKFRGIDGSALRPIYFDLANREAMDESAEWRRMFDCEAEKASNCNSELALENAALLSKIETLKQELEASRLKCRSREAPH